MKIPALVVSLALAGLSLSPPGTPAPPPEQAAVELPDSPSPDDELGETPAQPPRAVLAPTLQIEEISAPVPAGLQVFVKADKASSWTLTLKRSKQIVMLRRGAMRSAGEHAASLKIARGEEDTTPLLWETIHRDTLVTTRGTVHLDRAGKATLRLAEPPKVLGAIEHGRRHTCQPQDDGLGGVTVLCRVDAWITAGNASAADPNENVWISRNDQGAGLVRFDFPASGPGVTAMILGYTDGINGVVVRAEQTFLPGEAAPSLTVLSDDRRQPFAPALRRWHERFDPLDSFL